MGERKVLNKYYPTDFDPSHIPRRRQPKNQQINVRMMLPMSIRCNTCGNYINKGTKFNSRKEDVIGETYLGIQIFRFYFKCTKCSSELAIKTDPKNSDYVVESGAMRNFEPWRAEDREVDKKNKKRNAEMGDSMKSLENRTVDSKRQMDVLASLCELKSMKARRIIINTDSMLEALRHRNEEKKNISEDEDEVFVKSLFLQRKRDVNSNCMESTENPASILRGISTDGKRKGNGGGASKARVAFKVTKKSTENSNRAEKKAAEKSNLNCETRDSTTNTCLSSLCAAYGSDSCE